VERRNQILLTSQPSGVTTSELQLTTDSSSDKESRKNKILDDLSPSCLTRGAALLPTQPRIPTLRRDRDTKKLPGISAKT
jgi:hypothetical protein